MENANDNWRTPMDWNHMQSVPTSKPACQHYQQLLLKGSPMISARIQWKIVPQPLVFAQCS
jgi:hypothetical protein